jgi:hypothetical protein
MMYFIVVPRGQACILVNVMAMVERGICETFINGTGT